MNRITDISKAKLALGYVLIKIHIKERLILTPDSKEKSGPQVDYAEVVSVAEDIERLVSGDVVLDFRTTEGFEWHGSQYALVPAQNIKVAVDKSNFKQDEVSGRKTKRLLN